MIWENVESLSKLARIVPYLFIVLGFLVALGGQYVQSFINDPSGLRAQKLPYFSDKTFDYHAHAN